jgi:prepilin-type N-terminal cleavage/methylation domain-containing protein
MNLWRMLPHTKCRQTNNFNQGFTLIEIIGVLTVIAILAAMLVPSISGMTSRAKNTRLKHDLVVMDQALQLYRLDHDGLYPEKLEVLINEKYLGNRKQIKDASDGEFIYIVKGSGNAYRLSGKDASGKEILSDGSENI